MRSMIPFDDIQTLSLLYHLNSEPWTNKEINPELFCEVEYRSTREYGEPIALPATDNSQLLQLLHSRQSCRQYERQVISMERTSTIMRAAYGITRSDRIPNFGQAFFRTVPSGGGLYPLELYPFVQDVEGVSDGLYHYNVLDHALEKMGGHSFEEISRPLLPWPFVQNANLLIIISAVFARTQGKYGARGYRYILFEAGHVAQNICLAAAEQGLGSLCVGGFFDSKLNRILNLDMINEAALYCVAVGFPAPGAA